MHHHLHHGQKPEIMDDEQVIKELFPEGIFPDGVVPPAPMECHRGEKPHGWNVPVPPHGHKPPMPPCGPKPLPPHDVYRTMLFKLMRLIIDLRKNMKDVEEVATTLDDVLSAESENAVKNKAIFEAINEVKESIGEQIVLDDELDAESENAVKNMVIYAAISKVNERINELIGGDDPEDPDQPVLKYPDVAAVQAFTVSAEKPETPVGGQYFFTDHSFVPPSGWFATRPESGRIWFSLCTFRSDDTNSGWSEPVEFIDFDAIFDKMDKEIDDMYKRLIVDAKADVNSQLSEAKTAMEDAKKKLDEAKEILKDAKELLEGLEGEGGDQGIQEAIGKIKLFADWYDANAGTVTSLSTRLDAAEGKIESQGQTVNTLANTVTNVRQTLDSVSGRIENECVRVDTANKTITNVAQVISALEGKIVSSGSYKDASTGTVKNFKQEFDAINAKAETAVSAANTNKNEITVVKESIDALKASWKVEVERLDGDIAEAAKVEVTPTQITQAIADSNGVGATLIQKINDDGSETVIKSDKIYLDGDVIAKALAAKSLNINNKTVLNGDGSASFGDGKVSISKTGNVAVGNWTVYPDYIQGGQTQLNKSGEIKNFAGLNTFWKLGADGSAEFGKGNMKIDASGNIKMGQTDGIKDAVAINTNGTGSLAGGNISWDNQGNAQFNGTVSSTGANYKTTIDDGQIKVTELASGRNRIQFGVVTGKFDFEGTQVNLTADPAMIFFDATGKITCLISSSYGYGKPVENYVWKQTSHITSNNVVATNSVGTLLNAGTYASPDQNIYLIEAGGSTKWRRAMSATGTLVDGTYVEEYSEPMMFAKDASGNVAMLKGKQYKIVTFTSGVKSAEKYLILVPEFTIGSGKATPTGAYKVYNGAATESLDSFTVYDQSGNHNVNTGGVDTFHIITYASYASGAVGTTNIGSALTNNSYTYAD